MLLNKNKLYLFSDPSSQFCQIMQQILTFMCLFWSLISAGAWQILHSTQQSFVCCFVFVVGFFFLLVATCNHIVLCKTVKYTFLFQMFLKKKKNNSSAACSWEMSEIFVKTFSLFRTFKEVLPQVWTTSFWAHLLTISTLEIVWETNSEAIFKYIFITEIISQFKRLFREKNTLVTFLIWQSSGFLQEPEFSSGVFHFLCLWEVLESSQHWSSSCSNVTHMVKGTVLTLQSSIHTVRYIIGNNAYLILQTLKQPCDNVKWL